MFARVEKARSGLNSPARSRSPRCRGQALSQDEEIDLAARIADGDKEARNWLVQANLGLVVKVAREFQGRGLELEDLVGEGNLGLFAQPSNLIRVWAPVSAPTRCTGSRSPSVARW